MAPEIYSSAEPLTMNGADTQDDVYGVAMVIYDVRLYQSISPGPRDESRVNFLGFNRDSAALAESHLWWRIGILWDGKGSGAASWCNR